MFGKKSITNQKIKSVQEKKPFELNKHIFKETEVNEIILEIRELQNYFLKIKEDLKNVNNDQNLKNFNEIRNKVNIDIKALDKILKNLSYKYSSDCESFLKSN